MKKKCRFGQRVNVEESIPYRLLYFGKGGGNSGKGEKSRKTRMGKC